MSEIVVAVVNERKPEMSLCLSPRSNLRDTFTDIIEMMDSGTLPAGIQMMDTFPVTEGDLTQKRQEKRTRVVVLT